MKRFVSSACALAVLSLVAGCAPYEEGEDDTTSAAEALTVHTTCTTKKDAWGAPRGKAEAGIGFRNVGVSGTYDDTFHPHEFKVEFMLRNHVVDARTFSHAHPNYAQNGGRVLERDQDSFLVAGPLAEWDAVNIRVTFEDRPLIADVYCTMHLDRPAR